jgi:hypothetical protein
MIHEKMSKLVNNRADTYEQTRFYQKNKFRLWRKSKMGRECHLVGSVALNNAEEVFSSVSQILEGKIKVIREKCFLQSIENT